MSTRVFYWHLLNTYQLPRQGSNGCGKTRYLATSLANPHQDPHRTHFWTT